MFLCGRISTLIAEHIFVTASLAQKFTTVEQQSCTTPVFGCCEDVMGPVKVDKKLMWDSSLCEPVLDGLVPCDPSAGIFPEHSTSGGTST